MVASFTSEVNEATRLIRVTGGPLHLLPVSGQRIYTNLTHGNRNGVIDAVTDSLIKTFPVGNYPAFICKLSSLGKVYCSNTGDNTIMIIDAERDSVIRTLRVGANPEPMAVMSQLNKVYVVNRGDNPGTVTVIDGNRDSVSGQITVGQRPRDIVAAPDYNKVYVVNDLSNDVTVIDAQNDSVITTVAVGLFPWALCYNEKDGKVYVANLMQGTVSVIDCETDQKLYDIRVGGGPQVLMWTDEPGSLVFCINGSAQTVSVIAGGTDSVIATVPVGEYPCAFEQSGDSIWVANRYSSSLTVIKNLPVFLAEETGFTGLKPMATVFRRLPALTTNEVYDVQGRKVNRKTGARTGVFFVRNGQEQGTAGRKIIIVH